MEISFNDNLDKNFVKDLSTKLFEWTDQRWIITFSKKKGEISIKEKVQKDRINQIEKIKKSEIYKIFLNKFPDAELIDIVSSEKNDE